MKVPRVNVFNRNSEFDTVWDSMVQYDDMILTTTS